MRRPIIPCKKSRSTPPKVDNHQENIQHTQLTRIAPPRKHLVLRPARACSLARRDAPHDLPPQPTRDLPRRRLHSIVLHPQSRAPHQCARGRGSRAGRRQGGRLERVPELREAVEPPGEHFAGVGEREGVVLPQRDRDDALGGREGGDGGEGV